MTGSFHSRPESSSALLAILVAYQQRSASSPSPRPLQLHRVGAALKVCQVFPDCNWETGQLNCRCSWQLLANNFWRAWGGREEGCGTEWALSLSYGMSSMSTFMVFPLWIVLHLLISFIFSTLDQPAAIQLATGNWQRELNKLGIASSRRAQKAARQVNLTNESVCKFLPWLKSTEHVKFCSCTWKFSTQLNFHKLANYEAASLPSPIYLPHWLSDW